jgi:hypothetical protein
VIQYSRNAFPSQSPKHQYPWGQDFISTNSRGEYNIEVGGWYLRVGCNTSQYIYFRLCSAQIHAGVPKVYIPAWAQDKFIPHFQRQALTHVLSKHHFIIPSDLTPYWFPCLLSVQFGAGSDMRLQLRTETVKILWSVGPIALLTGGGSVRNNH